MGLVKAVGTNIVVELLEADEILGTNGNIIIPKKTKVPAMQAIILDIGPQLQTSDYGFKVGDRVVLDGQYVPVPRYDDKTNGRDICVFPPHAIKCVLDVEVNKTKSSSLIV